MFDLNLNLSIVIPQKKEKIFTLYDHTTCFQVIFPLTALYSPALEDLNSQNLEL